MLGTSFHTTCQPKMTELKDWLEPLIENFEAQSGSGDDRPSTIIHISELWISQVSQILTQSLFHPIRQTWISWTRLVKSQNLKTKRTPKSTSRPVSIQAQTFNVVNTLNTKLDSMTSQLVQTVKSLPVTPPQPTLSPLESVNWTPIIQALVTGVGSGFGLQVSSTQAGPMPATPPPLGARMNSLEAKFNSLSNSVDSLAQG